MEITIKKEAKEMLDKKLEENQFLRVIVTEGGCAGLTYSAEIAQEMKEDESIILQSGRIRIISDRDSAQYLNGLIISYSTDLIKGGLQFTNSSARSTCGCGQSFSLAGFPVLGKGNCGR